MERRLEIPDHRIDDRQSTYLVRLWFRPARPSDAWATDDWALEVADVREALTWASKQRADSFELFVRASDEQSWIRLYGEPRDGRETVIDLLLESDG